MMQLPAQYQENPVAQWLTKYWDDTALELYERLGRLTDEMHPETVSDEWLDFLALLLGFSDEYWDVKYPESTKRALLTRAHDIWRYKGTPEMFSYVLNAFGINHILRAGQSFILGESELGDVMGEISFAFSIILPENSPHEKLVIRLVQLYAPCWCDVSILFDVGNYFRVVNLLSNTSDAEPYAYEVLTVAKDEVLL
jgi:phage tail-like protein